MSNKHKKESFASVSSAIMMKIPTDNLGILRSQFQKVPGGLPINLFIEAVVSQMDLADINELMLMVADLIDFFHQVDINGDGFMEWEEFVMFTLDSVTTVHHQQKFETLAKPLTKLVQPPAVRNPIYKSLMVPCLGKIILGVGYDIQLYAPNEYSNAYTHLAYTLHMRGYDKNATMSKSSEGLLSVLDMDYLEEEDVLCVLRSDMHVEFFKFLSRSNYSLETIDNLGNIKLDQPCYKIRWKYCFDRPTRLLAIGMSENILTYSFAINKSEKRAVLADFKILSKHTDFVRDILVINIECARYICSASLDKSIILWDINTMEYRSIRTGHSAGVVSLAFDGKSLLFSGGNDHEIIVWDLEATLNRPLYRLSGHEHPIIQMIAMEAIERCLSLDDAGNIFWWDISRSTPNSTKSKLIDSAKGPEDHIRSIALFTHLGIAFNTMHGVMISAAGRRQHIFKILDGSVQESFPVCAVYSPTLLSIATIHSHDFILWNGVTGDQEKVVSNLVAAQARISCGILDDRLRRLALGDSNGVIRFYNLLNGALLKSFPPLLSAIKEIIYSRDKNLIVISETSEISIYDDCIQDPEAPSSNYYLRELKFSIPYDIAGIAYSYTLGLIATTDSLGTLILWDYIYLLPVLIIHNITGSDHAVNKLAFIPDYPLVVIADSSKNFTIVSIPTQTSPRQEIWRVDCVIPQPTQEELFAQDEEDDLENDESSQVGGKAKPFHYRRMITFKSSWREVKQMAVHCMAADEDDESITTTTECEEAKNEVVSLNTNESIFPDNLVVNIVCGFDDGTMSITNITGTLREMKISCLSEKDSAQFRDDYNSKSRVSRTFSDNDLRRALSSEEVKLRERQSTAELVYVFRPHSHTITSITILGEYKWLLTTSEDSNVQCWTIDAQFRGVLTRGTQMDKMFRTHWSNPEDMDLRNYRRYSQAEEMMKSLNLRQVIVENDDGSESHASIESVNKSFRESRTHVHRQGQLQNSDTKKLLKELEDNGIHQMYVSNLDTLDNTMKRIESYPERSRVIGQLSGGLTYSPSKKEMAKIQLLSKSKKPTMMKPKMRKRKKYKRGVSIDSTPKYSYDENSDDAKYFGTIKMADQWLAAPFVVDKQVDLGNWKYANEMSRIEALDPANWDISSTNRSKLMFPHMHVEIEKMAVSHDPIKIIESKLNALCPNGDFKEYYKELKAKYGSKRSIKSQAVAGVYKFENGQLLPSCETVNLPTLSEDDSLMAWERHIISNTIKTVDASPPLLKSEIELFSPPKRRLSVHIIDKDEAKQGSELKQSVSLPVIAPAPKLVKRIKNKAPFKVRSRTPSPTATPTKPPHAPLLEEILQLEYEKQKEITTKPKKTKQLSAVEAARQQTQKALEKFEARTTDQKELQKKNRKGSARRLSGVDSAGIQLIRQSTFEGMLNIAHKQAMADSNWVKKVRRELSQDPDMKVPKKFNMPEQQQKQVSTDHHGPQGGRRHASPIKLFSLFSDKRAEEERILARQSFGPYKTPELLQFFDVFKSLPKRDPDTNEVIANEVVVSDSESSSMKTADPAGDVSGYIVLQELIQHQYIKRRPHFRASLEKYLSKMADKAIHMNINKILLHMCPLMTATDRKDCIKFFSYQKTEEVDEVSVQFSPTQLFQFRQIFDYFDTDNSGTVDREEIKRALAKSSKQKQPNKDSQLKGDTMNIEAEVTADSIDFIVEEADQDGNDELDFDEFVKMFGDMFQQQIY